MLEHDEVEVVKFCHNPTEKMNSSILLRNVITRQASLIKLVQQQQQKRCISTLSPATQYQYNKPLNRPLRKYFYRASPTINEEQEYANEEEEKSNVLNLFKLIAAFGLSAYLGLYLESTIVDILGPREDDDDDN
jgi:hypothetical protein